MSRTVRRQRSRLRAECNETLNTQLELFPERVRLESCDTARNRLRFYSMALERDLFGSWCLVRHWGRIGSSGQLRTDIHASPGNVLDALSIIARQKRRRGYSDKPS